MLSKEESLEIIKKHPTKDVLMALIESMDGFHGLPLINRTRTYLESHWADNLWWPNEVMVEFVPTLFQTLKTNQARWTDGGSWSPEGEYYVDIIQCKLCHETIEISYGWKYVPGNADFKNPMHQHMNKCKKVDYCRRNSDSIEQFKDMLNGMIYAQKE